MSKQCGTCVRMCCYCLQEIPNPTCVKMSYCLYIIWRNSAADCSKLFSYVEREPLPNLFSHIESMTHKAIIYLL